MSRVLTGLVLLALVVLIALFTYYQKMDRKRFFARLYFDRNVDERLVEWLRAARALEGTLWADAGFWAEVDREIDVYDAVPEARPERRVESFNRIHGLFTDLRRRSPDSAEFARTVEPLNAMFRGFIEKVDTYNYYARAFNSSLEGGVGGVLADTFHIKGFADLEDAEL